MLRKNAFPADFKKGIVGFIFKRLGFLLLVLLLLVISFGTVKPDFYFLGWDNFSSYLNSSHNIFNTLFSTWREHRGLGVPSDAEVNDIFRQLFCWLAGFFVRKQIVDQLYMVFMLWGGVLGMYGLGRKVSRILKQNTNKQELFGFLTGFFYLFNLSTLAVFYFPMIMYNTRFFMLPTTTLVLLNLMERSRMSVRTYLFYLAVLFVGFGSFMVPTIFIVMMIMFLFMFLAFRKTKQVLTTFIFYILLGMYWILPFINYTVQKSAIVPQAPTFIEINEAMLNKPKSYYAFEQQAKLRPNFFESQFLNHQTGSHQPFHQLADQSEKGAVRWILWIFPIMYLLGTAYIFLFKRERILVCFALTVVVFLLFSMKEYSAVGFLYSFISDHVPFANTVFRFGDTKFHAMVAFGGSIIAAFFLVQILAAAMKIVRVRIARWLVYSVVAVFIFLHLFVYRTYFNGNFIGFFMYNKIPSAYFEIASIINQDPEAIRVIHLPFDSYTYWKPYRWGYFGSSFLHFMLEKPLFDRSFEPASMENADVHREIMDIVHMASSVPEESELEERALDLYQLLRSLSVKYVIDDQTVSTNIDARNIKYWGTISSADSHRLLIYLGEKGYLKLVKQYQVSLQDYSEDYAKLYPYNKKQVDSIYSPQNIQLYELLDVLPRVEFLSKADRVHTGHDSLLPPKISRSLGHHYIQAKEFDSQALIFPFSLDNSKVQMENGQIKISFPVGLDSGTYAFEGKADKDVFPTQIVNVYGQKMGNLISLDFESLIFPTIEGVLKQNKKSLGRAKLAIERDDYEFINIGETVLLLKNSNAGERQFIGSMLIRDDSVPVSLLYPQDIYDVGSHLVQLEPNPQCLHDGFDDAESHITGDDGILKIWGQNVSNCLTTEVFLNDHQYTASFAELEFDIAGSVQSLTAEKNIDTGKPILNQKINKFDNPLTGQVCIKPEGATECLNKDTLFRITKNKQRHTIPFIGDLTGIDKLLITFTVKSDQRQKYDTTTTNIFLKTYMSGNPEDLILEKPDFYSQIFRLEDSQKLNLVAPIATSDYSQLIDLKESGVLFRHGEECEKDNKTQGIRERSNGVLSYVVGCRNFVQKDIRFSSNNYYIWSIDYKHLSGAMPAFILMDKLNRYSFSKLLPGNVAADDYFSIPFQRPESFLASEKRITDSIDNALPYTVGGYLKPKFDLEDYKDKELIIQHYSENEGLIEIDNVFLIELPNYWPNSKIHSVNYEVEKFEVQGEVASYKRILPSLWQVKTDTREGVLVLFFNEGYDEQWKIFGAQTLLHARCDGYANCYKIKFPDGFSTFYLFYYPEMSNFIGLAITALTIIGGLFLYSGLRINIFF